MWIVAVAWIYVVGLMALTESNIVSGIMTFFGYCVLPLSLLYYLTGSRRRREQREAASNDADTSLLDFDSSDDASDSSDSGDSGDSGGGSDD